MSKYSFAEKMAYHEPNMSGSEFSCGYVSGGLLYSDYGRLDGAGRRKVKDNINNFARLARSGDEYAKGFMCAVRDAAAVRKSAR